MVRYHSHSTTTDLVVVCPKQITEPKLYSKTSYTNLSREIEREREREGERETVGKPN